MHIIVASTTKGLLLKNAKAVPRVGETIYSREHKLVVESVIWWPQKEILEKLNLKWQGYHISELVGEAAIEAMIMTA